MGQASIKQNVFYNGLLTVANYFVPLLVYPYVSRVLGVNNIGSCEFVDRIINYFVLFSMMGMLTLGTRTIATVRDDRSRLEKAFSSLVALNSLMTIAALVVLAVLTVCVPKLWMYRELMGVGACKIVFNFLLIDWFFKGLEDFRFITIRSLAIKVLYVAAVFLLVRKQDDYLLYYALTSGIVVLNAAVNWLASRKFVSFRWSDIDFRPYIRPFFALGLYMVLIPAYSTLGVIVLGFFGSEATVGCYSYASRLIEAALMVYTTLSQVLMPRMARVIESGDREQFQSYIRKSQDVLFGVSVPMVLIFLLFPSQIITLLFGAEFAAGSLPLMILSPLILIIGYEQLLVIQILLPGKQDSIVLRNTAIAAILGVIMCLTLIPRLGGIGSALVWISAESLILVLSQFAVQRLYHLSFAWRPCYKSVVLHIPLVLLILLMGKGMSGLAYLGSSLFLTGIYCIAVQWFFYADGELSNIVRKLLCRQ